MKTKMTPIVSWSIWAGGLSLVMGIVTRNHIIKGFMADVTGMSFVIAALFGAGLIVSFLAARQLHSEWSALAKIKKSHAIPKPQTSYDLASVFHKLDDYKSNGEQVNIHTAIDTYHSKHNSRVRSVSIMAALVISMGLLGTVIGLIMSISGLGSMVENIGLSRTTMMEALKATVAGMGTAFYTTFFGAMGGLILRAVAVSQLNSLSELCAEAAEYAEINLVPKLGTLEEELNKQVSNIVTSFEYMQQELDAITIRISSSVDSTMEVFGKSIEKAGSHAMEATQECIGGMTDEMHSFSDVVAHSFDTFHVAVEKAGEEAKSAVGCISNTVRSSDTELKEAFGELHQTIDHAGSDVTQAFGNLNSSVNQAGDTVAGSLADFKLSVDGTSLELKDAVGELHSAISQATGEMVTMAKAKLDTEATEIAGHLSIAADSIQQFLQHKGAQNDANQKVA